MPATPHQIAVLATLRNLHVSEYFELTKLLWPSPEDAAKVREEVKKLCASLLESPGRRKIPGLTELLRSGDYRTLIEALNAVDAERSVRVRTLLEVREYEERLALLKQESLEQYIDELRVVSRQEIYDAIESGTVVNGVDSTGRPLPIATDEEYSGTFLEQPIATAWLEIDTLVEVLREFGSQSSDRPYNPQGLRLRQVVIGGSSDINLNWIQLSFPLGFQGCDFYRWVSADYAEFPWLSFENCDFTPRQHRFGSEEGAFNAQHLRVTHELKFWECTGFSQLFIPDSHIGVFILRGAEPTADGANAFDGANGPEQAIRTVVNGAAFDTLIVTNPDEGEQVSPFSFAFPDSPPSIERMQGDLAAITTMLAEQEAAPKVWDEFADTLERSGRREDSVKLRINYQRWKNSKRRVLPRILWTVFVDWTVNYFHRTSVKIV